MYSGPASQNIKPLKHQEAATFLSGLVNTLPLILLRESLKQAAFPMWWRFFSWCKFARQWACVETVLRYKRLDSWSLTSTICLFFFLVLLITSLLVPACERLLLYLNAVTFRENSLIWLAPAGDRFFSVLQNYSQTEFVVGEKEKHGKGSVGCLRRRKTPM